MSHSPCRVMLHFVVMLGWWRQISFGWFSVTLCSKWASLSKGLWAPNWLWARCNCVVILFRVHVVYWVWVIELSEWETLVDFNRVRLRKVLLLQLKLNHVPGQKYKNALTRNRKYWFPVVTTHFIWVWVVGECVCVCSREC